MNKKIIALTLFVLFFLYFEYVHASNIVTEQSNNLKKVVNENTDGDIKRYISGIIYGEKGNIDMWGYIKDKIFPDLQKNIRQILSILVICLVYTLLINVQNSLKNSTVSKASFLVFFLSVVSIIVQNLKDVLKYADDIINRSANFSEALSPIILSILVSMGYVNYATILSPKVLFAVVFSSEFLKNIIVPIVNVYILISIVANLDNRFNLKRLLNILKSIILWSIIIGLVLFTGIVSVEGFTGATVDNVAAKSIKYTVGNFVPFVGKILSDAADTLAGSLSIIKNTSTIVGLLFLILVAGIPLFKILLLSYIFRLAASFIEMTSDLRFAKFLDDYADSLLLVFSIVFASIFLFIVSFASVLFIIQVGR